MNRIAKKIKREYCFIGRRGRLKEFYVLFVLFRDFKKEILKSSFNVTVSVKFDKND